MDLNYKMTRNRNAEPVRTPSSKMTCYAQILKISPFFKLAHQCADYFFTYIIKTLRKNAHFKDKIGEIYLPQNCYF